MASSSNIISSSSRYAVSQAEWISVIKDHLDRISRAIGRIAKIDAATRIFTYICDNSRYTYAHPVFAQAVRMKLMELIHDSNWSAGAVYYQRLFPGINACDCGKLNSAIHSVRKIRKRAV